MHSIPRRTFPLNWQTLDRLSSPTSDPGELGSAKLKHLIVDQQTRLYRDRFNQPEEATAYDSEQYAADSHSSFIWKLQQPVLRSVIERQRARVRELRLLDFACGTGRVLSFVENFVDQADGVDISRAMVERAAAKSVRARLAVGDVVAEATLCRGPYDVITAFRFLLNAEPQSRVAVLRALHARLDPENGLLIANVHGNATSLRHFALALRRRQAAAENNSDAMLHEMSPGEARELFRGCGFDVVEQIGFGILPALPYRTRFRQAAKWLDTRLAAVPLLRHVSVDLLFVCRPTAANHHTPEPKCGDTHCPPATADA